MGWWKRKGAAVWLDGMKRQSFAASATARANNDHVAERFYLGAELSVSMAQHRTHPPDLNQWLSEQDGATAVGFVLGNEIVNNVMASGEAPARPFALFRPPPELYSEKPEQ